MKALGRQLVSYISGTIIEKRTSAVSGELEVWYQNGKYVLHSPDANYSYDTLHRVFRKAFKKLQIKKRSPQQVLILGFGAGSVATILHDELKLNPAITAVELDPEVISLAKKYFHLDRFPNLTLHRDDASAFVKTCNQHFDLVVSDVFVNKTVPEKFLAVDYVDDLLRLTAHGAMGMMNIIAETSGQHKQVEFLKEAIVQRGAVCSVHQFSSINRMVTWTIP